MKKLAKSLSHRLPASAWSRKAGRFVLSSSIVALTGSALYAVPAVLQWDPGLTSSNAGGTGTWDTTLANWFNGVADQVWPNDGSTAVFGGTAGLVTLGAPITAGALQFDVTGYTIAGSAANPLTLSTAGGAASGFTFPAVTVGGGNSAVISAILAGTQGFHKQGAGTLVLSGANTFTSGLTIDAGTVQLGTGGTLNGNSVNLAAAGAVLQLGGVSTTIGNLDGGAGTTVENANATGATLTIAGSGSFAGTIQNGAGATSLNLLVTGSQTLIGSNTFAGTVTVSNNGVLIIAADSALGSASNGVTLDGGTLRNSATFTSARTVTLGSGGGILDITATGNLTLSAGLSANANPLTKTGTGTATLAGASTRTGLTTVTGGTLAITSIGGLGTGDVTVQTGGVLNSNVAAAGQNFQNSVTLAGGTFSHTAAQQLTFAPGKVINIGALGGTINTSGGTGTTGKLLFNAGSLTGSGILTKTGAADLQISGANPDYTGTAVNLNGLLEFQNVDALGLGAPTITANAGGEFVASAPAAAAFRVRPNFVLNAGSILSANGSVGQVVYAGSVTVAGNATAALRYFQTPATADSFTIEGPLLGAGTLTVTAPAAATLTLNGSRAGFTGTIAAGTNATVLLNGTAGGGSYNLTGGTVRLGSGITRTVAAAGTAGLNTTFFNFGSNPGVAANNFAVDQLYLTPRAFSRVTPNVNLPNPGANGTIPIVPVPGFATNIAAGGINDGVLYKGLLNITTDGAYQFSGTNDDNLILYIDGVSVGTLGVFAAVTNIGSAQTLTAGAHSIVVKQTQGTGGGYATLRYSGPDSNNNSVVIPPSAFTTGTLTPTNLGTLTVAGGTIDINTPSTATALNLGNGTLTLTSPTIDNLTVAGGALTGATPTLAPTTAGLVVTGPITEATTGLGLNFAGPYFAEFQGTNLYTGTTTVTAGQLRLNATTGNSVAGSLTINAANATGAIGNVRLQQGNQLADTGTLIINQGILDMNGQSDTVASLTLGSAATSGNILGGSGSVLTVNSAPTLNSGFVGVTLAGNYGTLTKASTSVVTLAAPNTFTGAVNINAGILKAWATNALGAGGAGNETTVATGASLHLQGSANATENVTINGVGVVANGSMGAIRNLGGVSSINNLTTGGGSTISVDAGELILNGVLDQSAGPLTKIGSGTLTFATPQTTVPAINFLAGALGFSGPQNFGAATVPAGLAFQFNTDPGAGVNVTVNAGSTVIANTATPQSVLNRLNAASTGTFALTSSSAANLDFSNTNVSLGATVPVTYSGTITPNTAAAAYRLGGGVGRLNVTSILSGNSGVQIGGVVQLSGTNLFNGGISVNAGGRLVYANDTNLGNVANVVTLNGGTLQFSNNADNTGAVVFGQFGNQVNGGGRVINVAAGGGVIDVPARQANGNSLAFTAPNTLTGAGALSKTGLGYLFLFNSEPYAGVLTVASNGGIVDLRAGGTLANVGGLVINQGATVQIDSQNGLGARQFPSQNIANRINDSAPVRLQGGTFTLTSRAATTNIEALGALTLGPAMSQLSTNANAGTSAAVINFGSLTRELGSTVRFGGNSGTFGAGTASAPGTGNTQITFGSQVGSNALGWASVFGTDLAAYDATLGVRTAIYTVQAAAAFTPVATNNYSLTGTGTTTLNAGNQELLGLKFTGAANAQVLAFTNATDILNVGSGGIITDGGAATRAIGAAALRGQLTAGPAAGNTVPRELFLHNNANTLSVFSTIIDNNGQRVTVVKDLDGTVVLDAPSTYSGGTFVTRGTLTANNTGSLGTIGATDTGAVQVRNSVLNLGAPGSVAGSPTTNAAVYTTPDNGEIVLTANTATAVSSYTAATDRFSISAGSTIYANSPGATFGLNSLTRVATPNFTAGGQIYLEPGSIVRYNMTNAPDQGTGILAINNLGTNADLFFSPGNFGGINQTVTIGAGTAYRGLSTDRNASAFTAGTIFANSDFVLQGLLRDNGLVALTLGAVGNNNGVGGLSIVNTSGSPIRASVVGAVAIAEDEPVYMPSNLTFVLNAGSIFQPNTTQALGFGNSQASVLVQAGATLDPGNYTGLGTAFNQQYNPDGSLNGLQNLPYPLISPVNGSVLVEAGGRFLINDASGIGSAAVGSWTLRPDAILELGTANAFYGRGSQPFDGVTDNTGVIQSGQFNFDTGAIIRLSADNIYKISQNVTSNTVLEIFGANRTLTSQNNPFAIPAVGLPTILPETVFIGSGGVLTNDDFDRQLNEGRGRLVLTNGAVLAATSQTYLNVQEGLEVAGNATITFGSPRSIDGNTKLGGVQLLGPNSNLIPNSANVIIADGSQLAFGAVDVWPDSHPLDLPTAVTTFPSPGALALQPGNGTSLLLNVANFIEVVGPLTGNGAIIGNQAGTVLATGFGATSDFSFNGVVKSTNGQNPSLVKIGGTKLTLTGTSDSTADFIAEQGTLEIAGLGSIKGNLRALKGATISINNTVVAQNNRTLGAANFYIPSGGTFTLIGNGLTPVLEQVVNFANSAGTVAGVNQVPGVTTLKVIPGAATTTLLVNAAENFQSGGIALQRSGTWVLNSPTITNGPVTYTTSGQFQQNGNTNGLIQIANPNFGGGAGSFGQLAGGLIPFSAGTSVALTRPDYLGDSNGDGVPEGFLTQDGAVNLVGTVTVGSNTIIGVTAQGLTTGMPITGTGIPANSIITDVNGSTVTISQNATAAGAAFNVVLGGMRLLTDAEYSPTLRSTQNTGLNVRLTGTHNTYGDTRIQTLTLTPDSVLNINGTLPLNATPSRLYVNDGGVFVQAGGVATINGTTIGGVRTVLQSNTGSSLFLHVNGNLNLNSLVFSDNAVVKTGEGVLAVGDGAFGAFRGSLQIGGGTVNLGPNNSLSNIRAAYTFTTNGNLFLNGGTLNLGGNSQYVGQLNNNNPLPGMGGTLTSSTAATVTVSGGGIFSGTVTGPISLDKTGNNTLTLTNANTNTGTVLVRSNALILRDSGTLTSASGLEIQNATLQLDNGYLSNVANRVAATTPVTMKGGTLNLTGAAGQVASQTFANVTLASGLNLFSSNAGGSGANELTINNLNRANGTGAYVNFGQTYGFLGAAGNTTAIRDFVGNVNGVPLTLRNNVIANWAIVNGSNFATYQNGVGVGAMGNTADGFANYSSTDITAALATDNVNEATAARTLTASKTINSLRFVPGAAATVTFNSGVGLTVDTGGLLSDANFTVSLSAAADARGNFITSNTPELGFWVNQNTNGINIPITGAIDFVKSGPGGLNLNPSATLNGTVTNGSATVATANTSGLVVGQSISGTGIPAGAVIASINPNVGFDLSTPATAAGTTFVAAFGNAHTGKTIVNGGTLTLNQASASQVSLAIPGDLVINNAIVTEANVAGQIKNTANITVTGNGRFNAVSLAGVTETIGSLTVAELSGTAAATQILDRVAVQANSTVVFSSPTAITVTNTNPLTVPAVGSFLGIMAFNPTAGNTSTLLINAPTTVNGLAAVGLRNSAQIGAIPSGGLVKSGTGILVLDTAFTNFTGITTGYDPSAVADLGTLVNALNIQQGAVRFDTAGALGTNTANTTVQNGGVLLGSNVANTVLTGSVTLNAGATLAATINAFTLGAATTTPTAQSVLNIPSGNVFLPMYDYFVPSTNAGNITVNGRLTGSGTINLTGPQITQGAGAGGFLQLGNPILTGAGSNEKFTGNIVVGPNAILRSQVALAGGATRTSGNALGKSVITLAGGRLSLREDGSSTSDTSNGVFDYLNNLILTADSFIDGNRTTSTTAVNNTINMGTLTVPSGTKGLTVDSGNNYQISVSQLIGPGTLIKSGASLLNILDTSTGIADRPSFGFAGPTGRTFAPTFNTTTFANTVFAQTDVKLQDVQMSGFYITPANKTFNLAGTFFVNANTNNISGQLAVSTGNGVPTIVANKVVNNGQIGATGGAATITATQGFSGNGLYVTRNQDLTLDGSFTNGTLRVAGNTTVNLTGPVTSSAVEVQSGTLRLAPTTVATSSGSIRVLGTPQTDASPTTNPVEAVTGTLILDAGTSGISHTGNIVNNGTVRATSGVTTINGTISGTGVQYVPGLLEGMIQSGTNISPYNSSAGRQANPGNFGIKLEPRMAQTNIVTQNPLTGWTDGQLWIYTGYVHDDDGVFSFAENIDDNAGIWVDGNKVLDNSTYNVVTSTAYTNGTLGAAVNVNANVGTPTQNFGAGTSLNVNGVTSSGWHLLEIRIANGAGGAGPVIANGFTANFGLGFKNGIGALDGADYIKPIDDGTGTFLVTPVGGSGNIAVEDGARLVATGFNQIGTVSVGSGNGTSLELTGAAPSAADTLLIGGVAAGSLKTVGSVTVSALNVAPLASLNVTGGGSLRVTGLPTDGFTGSVNLSGATLAGTGTVLGSVSLTGGTLEPGLGGVGHLTVGSLQADAASTLRFDLAFGFADQLTVTGDNIDVTGSTLALNLVQNLNPSDVYLLLQNLGADQNFGTFANLSNGTTFNQGGYSFKISYFDDPTTAGVFETSNPNGTMTGVSLLVVIPEPSALGSLMVGLGSLAGLRRFRRRSA